MHVLMLSWTYYPEPQGGAERQCRLLAQALTERGTTVSVLTSRVGNQLNCSDSDGEVKVLRVGFACPLEYSARQWIGTLPDKYASSRGRLWRMLLFWGTAPIIWFSRFSFILGLMRWCWLLRGNVPFDVLHVHESGWLAGVGVRLGRLWRCPVICKEATSPALGPIPYGMPLRRLMMRWRMKADRWIAQSPATADQLQLAGVDLKRIRIIRNGVQLPEEEWSSGPDPRVLYVGNLTQGAALKAFDVLFDAWIRVSRARPDVKLIVVGAGDPAPWLRRLRDDQAEHTVEFKGWMNDLSSVFVAASVFVLPSRVEGMSNALLEAMAWRLPCVVSDIPGNMALIRHEVNGIVVPVGDAEALAGAIKRLLDSAALANTLGSAARQTVATEYGIGKVSEEILTTYVDAIKEYEQNI
jgi:glycosyltransferase involved in cell wall biosynthesis